MIPTTTENAGVAQQVEHFIRNEVVVGSRPTVSFRSFYLQRIVDVVPNGHCLYFYYQRCVSENDN